MNIREAARRYEKALDAADDQVTATVAYTQAVTMSALDELVAISGRDLIDAPDNSDAIAAHQIAQDYRRMARIAAAANRQAAVAAASANYSREAGFR